MISSPLDHYSVSNSRKIGRGFLIHIFPLLEIRMDHEDNFQTRHYFIRDDDFLVYGAMHLVGSQGDYFDNLFDAGTTDSIQDPRALKFEIRGDEVIKERFPIKLSAEELGRPDLDEGIPSLWQYDKVDWLDDDCKPAVAWWDYEKDVVVFCSTFGLRKPFLPYNSFSANVEMSAKSMTHALQPHLSWVRKAHKIAIAMRYTISDMFSIMREGGDVIDALPIDKSFTALRVLYLVVWTQYGCFQARYLDTEAEINEDGFMDYYVWRDMHGKKGEGFNCQCGEDYNCECDHGVKYLVDSNSDAATVAAAQAKAAVSQASNICDHAVKAAIDASIESFKYTSLAAENYTDPDIIADARQAEDDSTLANARASRAAADDVAARAVADAHSGVHVEPLWSKDNEVALFMHEQFKKAVGPDVEVKLVVDLSSCSS